MKKVIVIIRESTIRQEIESQRDEIINYVLSEGYTASEIEVVGESGLSAIKMDDSYLRALKKVYSIIETTPTIECVYAWAIDRIGRNEEILMNFKNFLINKQINLKIKNPNLSLLNDDGTINYGMELAFSLFSTMSKQEMEQKKERFKRAKARNRKEGKFNGGAETRFGYQVENGYFVVNKEESDIVRLIFEEYSTGNYSMQKLADELNSRGLKHRDKQFNILFIHHVLEDKTYIGEGNKPIILDPALFDVCKKIRTKQTSTRLTKESKTIHLATKLLKCRECGSNYIASFDRYICYKHKCHKKFTDVCNNNLTITISVLDNLLWEIAHEMHKDYLSKVDDTKIEELDRKLEILGQKVLEIINKIEGLKTRRERIIELYTDGITTKEQYNSAMDKVVANLNHYNTIMDGYNEKIAIYNDMAYKLRNPEQNIILDIKDNADKKPIVNQHIKSVYLERYEKTGTKIIINDTINYLYRPKREGLIRL